MKRNKIILRLGFLVGLVVLAIASYAILSGNDPEPEPMPNPNGFEDFLRAAKAAKFRRNDKMTREELSQYVATNAFALQLVSAGLDRECLVTEYYYETNYFYLSGFVDRLVPQFIMLPELFDAEVRLAKAEGRTNDAARYDLKLIQFAQKSCRGGLLMNDFDAMLFEGPGLKDLKLFLNNLDGKVCKEIAKNLEQIDQDSEPMPKIINRENHHLPIPDRLQDRLKWLVSFRQRRRVQTDAIRAINEATLSRRTVMLSFASRAYELERGKTPPNAAALVPDYLKQIPKDPTTGTNLILGN